MENNKMSAESWLNVIKQASDYNESMTPLIKKYGELLTTSLQKQIEELKEVNKKFRDDRINQYKKITELSDQLSQKDEMLERMAEVFKFALGMKELWMTYTDSCAPEHEEEAIAIQSMHNKFIDCLTQYQNSKK